MYAPPAAPPPLAKRWPTWVIVLLSIGGFFVVVMPIFAVLAVYGVRKYLANAKMAEARNALGQIAKDAAAAYEKNHALCPSASSPVPRSLASIRGSKYQSAQADWEVDRSRNAGFACLQFSMDEPQYFQYSYVASPQGRFEATAHGDLNGDGKVSTFIVRGEVSASTLTVAPTIEETDPQE
jgi:type IV pilus assembly protein PilA